MEETAKPNQSGKPAKSGGSSPILLGILALLFGLVLPPLGLILAIIAVYKAGQKANKSLLVLGVAAAIAAVAQLNMIATAIVKRVTATSFATVIRDNEGDSAEFLNVCWPSHKSGCRRG